MSKNLRSDVNELRIKLYGLLNEKAYRDISKMDRDEILRIIAQIDYLSEVLVKEWEKQNDPVVKDLLVVFIYILMSGPEYWKKEIQEFIIERKWPATERIYQ